jgi:glutamate-1-semialdehyde aminotransferase
MMTDARLVRSHRNRVTLTDGREYVDWQMGLAGPVYGYAPYWWRRALRRAANSGPTSSIAAAAEPEVAAMLTKFYPDIEAVRFMCNGSDPCAAAAKLARAVTDRPKLVVYGYHGTSPSYCTPPEVNARPGMPVIDMRRGTLPAERAAFVPLAWLGGLPPLHDVAAVVVETPPMDGGRTESTAWLKQIIKAAHDAGALFVLDEVVTAFRYGPGGAAEYYGIQGLVDLYAFGKTLGNGYPVAALAGRRVILDQLTKGVHFSGTFFGEPLGLALAQAMLEQLQQDPPWEYLYRIGEYLQVKWNDIGLKWRLVGHPTRPVIEPRTEGYQGLRRCALGRGHIIVDAPWYMTTTTTTADADDLVGIAREWVVGEGAHGD